MSDFFDPPPPPPQAEPSRYRTPEWMSAPNGTLPGVVALDLVLARNDRVAVCVTRLAAYPTGFEFELVTMTRSDVGDEELDPFLFAPHRRRHRGSAADDDVLRIGVQFADGGKATNVGVFHLGEGPPAGPVLHSGGGGGGGGSWRQNEWVWPLPPPGPVSFVCEWPAAGIALTRHEIDAGVIREAAARAQVIFSEEDLPDHPGGNLTVTVASGTGTKADPWTLKTPPGSSEYTMHRDEASDPPSLVCQVGSTKLSYRLSAIEDLHAWLREQGDWVPLGAADEMKDPAAGTVEAWGRAQDNPVGGWYGLRKGYRGRFGMYMPPLLEALGLAELTHEARKNTMRAI